MARVYIASKYSRVELNREVERRLTDAGFDVFLPEHIGARADSREGRELVLLGCLKGLFGCDVLLAIGPCGNDVSGEVGIAFSARLMKHPYLIVRWNTDDETSETDDMIHSMIDFESSSLDQVIRHISDHQPYLDEPLAKEVVERSA